MALLQNTKLKFHIFDEKKIIKLLRVYWYQKCEIVLFISEKESKLPVFKSYQSTQVECIFNKTVEEILEIIDRLFTQLLCPNIKTGSIWIQFYETIVKNTNGNI